MVKYKLSYSVVVKDKKERVSKSVNIPEGSKRVTINKVRTGDFVEIFYVPKNAKVLGVSRGKKVMDFKIKTIKLPKSNFKFFEKDIKFKKA